MRRKKVVRGPQLKLPLGRTPRLRFIEPPSRIKGSPFFAVRVPKELLSAFGAYCKRKHESKQAVIRAYMSRVTGVRPEVES